MKRYPLITWGEKYLQKSFNPYLEVVIASIIWGSSGVFIKTVNLPATTMAFFRALLPAAISYFYLKSQNVSLFTGNHRLMYLASVLNAARMLLYFIGFSTTSVGNAVVMLYTGPIITTILSTLLLKEKLTFKIISAALIAFFGIAVIYSNKPFSFADRDFLGMTAILTSTVLNSGMTIIFKKEIQKYRRSQAIFYQNLVSLLLFIPFFIINRPIPNFSQIFLASIYGLLIGAVAFSFFFSALRKIAASTAVILTYLEVVSAFVFAYLFLHEQITVSTLVGAGFILASIIILNTKKIFNRSNLLV
ncbi:EamA/RhaT family transporter [Candidatus Parcubacteria bacterium]|nr:MAG: EamA/RhaT family transporter [Candidatus Parcubacteria bacterium]